MLVNTRAPPSSVIEQILRYLLPFLNFTHHRPRIYFLGHQVQAKCLSQSIARVFGRLCQRISSGGVHDEAKIHGRRSAHVVSGPRLAVKALCKSSCINPVILLDKVDKIGQSNFH